MKKKFSVAGLVFVALCTMAATIQWYSQQPATTALTDSMVIAVERPVPHGYLSTTLASLKGYTGTNTILVSSNVYTTNLYTTNLYSSNVFTTNLFSTNVYTTNLYSSNAFITNITVNNITSQTNYFTDLTVESNVTFNGKVTINNITVTNGITNLNLVANTIVKADANSALASVPNGTGALTNDGSGNFGWSALSGGDQVWTNDGTFIYQVGYTNYQDGVNEDPPFVIQTNGQFQIGRNVKQDYPSSSRIYFPYASTMQDSNELTEISAVWQTLDSSAYTWSSTIALNVAGPADHPKADFSLGVSGTNGNSVYLWLNADSSLDSANPPFKLWLGVQEQARIETNGIFVGKTFIATEQAWSGPTNQMSIGEWTYTANTPCAVTNIVSYGTNTGNCALLSITNASSSNITFTVYSPIRIPYGETSRSYTITNGDVFFGSFRKGAHGSAFVPRGFWQP